MARRHPSRSAVTIAAVLLVALIGWTALTLGYQPFARLDRRLAATPPPLTSGLGQVAAAFALLTWPGLVYAGLAGVAIWAYQRRLRQLAVALTLVIVSGWGGGVLFGWLVGRERPDFALDLLTTALRWPPASRSALSFGSPGHRCGASSAGRSGPVCWCCWWRSTGG